MMNHRLFKVTLLLALVCTAVALMAYDDYKYLLVVVHLTTIPAVLYPLVYARSPWKKGPTGKALMNMARAVGILYAVAVWGVWQPFGIYPYVYATAVTYLGVAITYQFYVMLRLKRAARFHNQPGMEP